MALKEDSDIELWQNFKNGSQRDIEILYLKYSPILFRYGAKFSVKQNLIEDAIHDVFEILIFNKDRLVIHNSVKFYLLQSFKNNLIKKLKNEAKWLLAQSYDWGEFAFESSPEQKLIETQNDLTLYSIITQKINELPARQKEALYLKYYESLSYDEIADLLSIDLKSAYKLIYKAIDSLDKNLSYVTNIKDFIPFATVLIYVL